MDVRKDAGLEQSVTATEEELALINRWSRKELTAEEVYAFTVKLCDNEIDRDGERFTTGALEALAEKFVGKSGIFDHRWSAAGQSARIYKAEVVCEPGAKPFYAWPGDLVELTLPGCPCNGRYRVLEAQAALDEKGCRTELTLGDVDAVL